MEEITEEKIRKKGLEGVITRKKALLLDIEQKSEYPDDTVLSRIENIEIIIKDYGLEERLIHETVRDIHDALMKAKRFEDAESIAKRYGL